MAKGRDERHNPNRKVGKSAPLTLSNLVMGRLSNEDIERQTLRRGKEYVATKSQDYNADPLFVHNEHMEQAELRAEQIKDMRKSED